jgi:hypothetical protein
MPMPNRGGAMKSRIFFVLAAVSAAAILIGSPRAKAQQRRTASIASLHADARPHAGSTFHPVNGAGSLGRRRRFRFHEHRRMRAAGPFCINTGLPPTLLQEFPNYGFDFEHVNALDADLSIKAAIDPATQLRLSEAEDLGCAIGEPWNFLGAGDDDSGPDEDDQQAAAAGEHETEPQIVILQESPASPATAPTKSAEVLESGPPLPDEGQFVLVLRDGSRLEAVAFSRSENQVVYITTEGTRETLPLSGLDLEATVRVNEERGTPIELSF